MIGATCPARQRRPHPRTVRSCHHRPRRVRPWPAHARRAVRGPAPRLPAVAL